MRRCSRSASGPQLADLPLIAVTAKAMKGDRQKCLDAGASDYIAKPVDIELLLALLRVWVARSREAAARPLADRDGGRGVRHERARRRYSRAAALRPERRRRSRAGARRACSWSTTTSATCSPSQTVLEDLGEVVSARSGEEALRHLLKGEFAVILLDVYMPGMDGYETAQIIRSRDQTKGIPIVFLSAVNKEAEHLLRGYSMGAVDYVFKPVDPVVLRSKVAVFVDLFAKTKEIERKARQEQALLDANLRANAERLRAEQELRRAEQRQAAIIQSLPMVLYLEPYRFAAAAARIMSAATSRRSPASLTSKSQSDPRSGPNGCIPRIATG